MSIKKTVCPYCGSDDVYEDNASHLKTLIAKIFNFFVRTKPNWPFTKPDSSSSYHCFNCGKDFNQEG